MLTKQITKLYTEKQLSGVEIARKVGLPVRQIYRILEKSGIPRRMVQESNAIQFLRQPPSFKIKKKMIKEDIALLISGVMLYWAEGASHPKKSTLDFTNSDYQMIQIFLRFLREICGVDKNRIRVYLYCYANQKIPELLEFWSRVTKTPLVQFTKPYVRKDFRKDKIGCRPYGVVHVKYADKKLYEQLEVWRSEILNNLLSGCVA